MNCKEYQDDLALQLRTIWLPGRLHGDAERRLGQAEGRDLSLGSNGGFLVRAVVHAALRCSECLLAFLPFRDRTGVRGTRGQVAGSREVRVKGGDCRHRRGAACS